MMGKQVRETRQNSPSTSTKSPFATRPFAPPVEVREPPAAESLERAARFGHRFADVDIFPRQVVQPKLALRPAGDRYEREADEVARRVVERISSPDRESIQRQEDLEDEEELDLEEDGELRRKVAGFAPAAEGADVGPDLESSIHRARSGGQPLSEGVRQPMEQAFGADFSGVRVHADGEADSLSRSLQAQAFTTVQDIFMRRGEYRPGSSEGQRLLAHELTHVVQQRVCPRMQLKDGVAIKGYTRLEHETNLMEARTDETIQREVRQATREKDKTKKNKWYSTFDETRYFDTKEDAENFEKEYLERSTEEREKHIREQREKREAANRKKLEEEYPDYKPPVAAEARLYDTKGEHRDVSIISPNSAEAKEYAQNVFARRRAGRFETEVMKLGGQHFVLQPGTDVSLVPANLRPDLTTPPGFVPLSREGHPKTYSEIVQGLDEAAESHAEVTGFSLEEIRSRMGKDIDRLSRGNSPTSTLIYSPEELKKMNELAGVLRLDKGRVRKATKYVRGTVTSGESFKVLFVDGGYKGAGEGGVERLREQQTDEGASSQGSDIEEEKTKKRGKEVYAACADTPTEPPAKKVGRIAPEMKDREEIKNHSWNKGDQFMFRDGLFQWTKDHIGGMDIDEGDLYLILRGG